MIDIKPEYLKAYYPHYEQLCDIDWISLTDETIGVLVRDKKLGSFVDSTNLSSVQLRIVNTVRDERSEESAIQAERTRIIKALKGLNKPGYCEEWKRIGGCNCGYSGSHDRDYGHNQALNQAIKAVGESAGKEDE